MKCTVSPAALSSALNLVSRAVSPRSTLPVLGNVLLEAADETLRVTATNLDLTISASVAAEVRDEGRITVPARLLSDYAGSLSEAPCTMVVDEQTQVLKLSCGVHRSNLHGISAVEFPPLPQAEDTATVEVDPLGLQNAITQVAMAASSDSAVGGWEGAATPVLTGVLMQFDEGRLTLAATDRHRLAVKTLETTTQGEQPPSGGVIVPARHLSEVARAVSAQRGPTVSIALSRARNQAYFTMAGVSVSSRLIDGTYPNYAQVIPGESSTTVSLSTSALLREAKTAAVLARDAANPVRLRIGDNTLTLVAQTAEVGDDEAPLTAAVTGEEMQIAFNARYMLDALAVLDSDDVQLSFNGPRSPGVIRPMGRDDYLCIIMPVRVPM